MSRILVINPGSTSTRIALYEGVGEVFEREFQHPKDELAEFETVFDQIEYRKGCVDEVLNPENIKLNQVDAVVGRGGLLKPISGGVYEINDKMIADLKSAQYGEHPCNLGAPLARQYAMKAGVPCYIADPVVSDEMDDRARITGHPAIRRRSVYHALSQRGAARKVAEQMGLEYENANFIVLHLGGGISIGAHCQGRVADVINALDGEGPFSPERTGALPAIPLLELVADQGVDGLRNTVLKAGGLWAHLGTNDLREVAAMIDEGDEEALLVFEAMAYGVARHAWSLLPAFADSGRAVDGLVVTGGMARSEAFVSRLKELVGSLAPVVIIPGSVEMEALARWGELALSGAVSVSKYT